MSITYQNQFHSYNFSSFPLHFQIYYVMLRYEFLSKIAFSFLRVSCYQRGSCVGGPVRLIPHFGDGSRSHNIFPLDNHLSGLSISLSSLALSWVSVAVIQVFGMTRLSFELTTFRSGGERSTFTLSVGSSMQEAVITCSCYTDTTVTTIVTKHRHPFWS